MAKVSFSKLNLNKNTEVSTFEWGDQIIEVKDYLPIGDKLNLISEIINDSIDKNGYYNPARVYLHTILKMIMAYTNVSFTDKQKEDPKKLYDLVVGSGFSAKVFGEINPGEYAQIKSWVAETIHSIYEYKNSAAGILDIISTDYKDTTFDMEQLTNDIQNPETLGLLKDILTKLG